MKMKRGEEDVTLTNGEGYMVESQAYHHYLKNVTEETLKSKCVNHRAISQANANRHNLEVAVPTQADVCYQLEEEEKEGDGRSTGSVGWLITSFNIEEAHQIQLQKRIEKFNTQAKEWTTGEQIEGGGIDDSNEEEDNNGGVEVDEAENDEGQEPERMKLVMPLVLGKARCISKGLDLILSQELALRKAQAEESLQKLWLALGLKALLLRIEV
ncbi:hypothetical protein JAAARDRAFT_192472 [Jaapia argillacea MUCL 33604]|uniref:Uncharacterized protein n=1 Tax=Jaapia argillacea MUCL 33604 TaxID=933084 RepID=A0A067PVY1_9AGAM|nr:hypothetical protein JAAARDRAFT_192472 [Jaapia argillacea MUCL 33604]